MSSTNYDVELNIAYNNSYRHYIPTYTIMVPANYYRAYQTPNVPHYTFDSFVSFDDGSETELNYGGYSGSLWAINGETHYWFVEGGVGKWLDGNILIPDTGVFSKVYIRNPYRNRVTFTSSNCAVQVMYNIKAAFEIQWNSVGFAANQNASFKCSTIPKNTYGQYEWTAATVYYKESTASTYQSVSGTISGSWSDVTISTNISLSDGVTYDVYITATSDDGTTASTPVGQFTTTDAAAVATCLSPVGAFTQGNVTFIWSHATEYGTPQYAFDLQYSNNNGSSWTTVSSHEVTTNTTKSATLSDAGTYKWRVRTYNSNDVVGEWAEASFVNNVPANPPTNLSVNTKGRPTVTWASVSQSAYQVQFLLGDSIAYDSGAVYTSQTSHFVNQYFNDTRSYVVRLRVYNALGEVSEWVETGYQQTSVADIDFTVTSTGSGATITVIPQDEFTKYYLLRNNKLIAQITDTLYNDSFAVGLTNYSVVAVTSADQSDIQTKGINILYSQATIVALNGQQFLVNKRVDMAFEIQTNNEADVNKAQFIGDQYSTHYPNNMRLKSFTVHCFDDQGIAESLLGQVVFYADNFGNGGYCMVMNYEKTDNFIKNGQGIYANEVSLTLEVTNYDDSIEYPI